MNEKWLRAVISTCFIGVAFNDAHAGYPFVKMIVFAVLSAWLLFIANDIAERKENAFLAGVTTACIVGALTLFAPWCMTQKILATMYFTCAMTMAACMCDRVKR